MTKSSKSTLRRPAKTSRPDKLVLISQGKIRADSRFLHQSLRFGQYAQKGLNKKVYKNAPK